MIFIGTGSWKVEDRAADCVGWPGWVMMAIFGYLCRTGGMWGLGCTNVDIDTTSNTQYFMQEAPDHSLVNVFGTHNLNLTICLNACLGKSFLGECPLLSPDIIVYLSQH